MRYVYIKTVDTARPLYGEMFKESACYVVSESADSTAVWLKLLNSNKIVCLYKQDIKEIIQYLTKEALLENHFVDIL